LKEWLREIARNADGADDLAILLDKDSSGKDHDFAIVGGVNSEEPVPS